MVSKFLVICLFNALNIRLIKRYKNGVKITNDGRRETQKSTLIIREATSAIDAGDYSCMVSSMSVRGGSQFGQLIQLRGNKPF